MNRLAILPAAGNAARFGGLYKELLPVSNGENALQAAYRRVCVQCDNVVIITTPEKITLHAHACPRASFVIKPDDNLFGALLMTMQQYPADEYYFTMPDTVWEGTWPKEIYNQLDLGMFQTYEPSRFGVLHGNQISDKAQWPHTNTSHLAWGALAWTREVKEYWLTERRNLPDLTTALNAAMKRFGYSCFQISDYHDFANLSYYTRYLQCLTSNPTPNRTA